MQHTPMAGPLREHLSTMLPKAVAAGDHPRDDVALLSRPAAVVRNGRRVV